MGLSRKIAQKNLGIFHYHKYSCSDNNIYEFGHDDFIISFGTIIYKGKTGSYALKFLVEDFLQKDSFHYDLCGHYAIVISFKNQVYCFIDYFGLYGIYFDTSQKVFSNSFLAYLKHFDARESKLGWIFF